MRTQIERELEDSPPEETETTRLMAVDHEQLAGLDRTADGRRGLAAILLEIAGTAGSDVPVTVADGVLDFRLDLAHAAWNHCRGDDARRATILASAAAIEKVRPGFGDDNVALTHLQGMIRYCRAHFPDDDRVLLHIRPCPRNGDQLLEAVWREGDEPPPDGERIGHGHIDRSQLTVAGELYTPADARGRRIARGRPRPTGVAEDLGIWLRARASRRTRIEGLLTTGVSTAAELSAIQLARPAAHMTRDERLAVNAHNRLAEILVAAAASEPGDELAEYILRSNSEAEYLTGAEACPESMTLSLMLLHDHPLGPDRETWCQAILTLAAEWGIENALTRTLRALAESRPQLLQIVERDGERVAVRELIGGDVGRVKLWENAGIELPPETLLLGRTVSVPGAKDTLVMARPYVLTVKRGKAAVQWRRWAANALRGARSTADRHAAYDELMKFGPSGADGRFWRQWLHDAHTEVRDTLPYLQGLPPKPTK